VNLPVISSTFFLTLLMMIGLFFFIRASVKDRTKQIQLIPEESADVLVKKLQEYFEARAYQLTSVDPETKQVAFTGYVQPSVFLAVLLSFLAVVGLSCLTLVLWLLFPNFNQLWWLLLLVAPLAGVFYWQKAGRWEKILLQVIAMSDRPNLVRITAHRDELIQLQQNLRVEILD
jgi:Cofactor assembly of complex C subunit B